MRNVPKTRRVLAAALGGLLAAATATGYAQSTPQNSPDGRSGISNPQSGPISKGAQTPQRTEAAGAIRQQGAPMPGQRMQGGAMMQGGAGGPMMQGGGGGPMMQGGGGGRMMQGAGGNADDPHAAMFDVLDLDHDGRLSRSEASHSRGVATHWSELDANRDGSISKDEFASYAFGSDASTRSASGSGTSARAGGSANGNGTTRGR